LKLASVFIGAGIMLWSLEVLGGWSLGPNPNFLFLVGAFVILFGFSGLEKLQEILENKNKEERNEKKETQDFGSSGGTSAAKEDQEN